MINVKYCPACGNTHEQLHTSRDEGAEYYLCERRFFRNHPIRVAVERVEVLKDSWVHRCMYSSTGVLTLPLTNGHCLCGVTSEGLRAVLPAWVTAIPSGDTCPACRKWRPRGAERCFCGAMNAQAELREFGLKVGSLVAFHGKTPQHAVDAVLEADGRQRRIRELARLLRGPENSTQLTELLDMVETGS